tara:strand:- start:134 stop:484 length:351 start_codon:yes stop_codon:yes gene_type:complete
LEFVTSGNLLEIGPSFGTFVLQAKKVGFEVATIEMDKRCYEFLSRSVGINTINSNSPELAIKKLEKHDVIALIFLSKIGQMLAFIKGGVLSLPFALWEGMGMNGSAYTVIYQKVSK